MAARAIVLVIDDDFDFVEFARIVLESGGMRISQQGEPMRAWP